jgi:hypothetical protein
LFTGKKVDNEQVERAIKEQKEKEVHEVHQ